MATLKDVENRLLEAMDRGDSDAVELLKSEYIRLQTGASGGLSQTPSRPRAAIPPAGAAGAPRQSRAGESPAIQNFLAGEGGMSFRDLASVGVTAPAQAVAGAHDIGAIGGNFLQKKLGFLDEGEEPPLLGPKVDDLTNALAGRKVPHSVPRAMFEGAVTAPMAAAKGAARLPALVAGITSGGASESVSQWLEGKDVPTWVKMALPIVAGVVGGQAGRAPGLQGLSWDEAKIKARVKEAIPGLSERDLDSGIRAMKEAVDRGVPLFPSQAIQAEAPGLLKLQEVLGSSRVKGASDIQAKATSQPEIVADRLRMYKGVGGQSPREPADLADATVDAARQGLKAERDAVNASTRGGYNAPSATRPIYGEWTQRNIHTVLDKAIADNHDNAAVVAALKHGKAEIDRLFKTPNGEMISPGQLHESLRTIRENLPDHVVNGLRPAGVNHVRDAVTKAIAPIENHLQVSSPELRDALRRQAAERSNLSGAFDELTLTGKGTGGPKGVLDNAMKRGEVVQALRKYDPQAAQELLQRHLNQSIDSALDVGDLTKLPKPGAGIKVAKDTRPAFPGSEKNPAALIFDQELPALFRNAPDPEKATEGFRRSIEVLANASKPTGVNLGYTEPTFWGEVVRGGAGSQAQQVNVIGRLLNRLSRLRTDKALAEFMQRPDVMERLKVLGTLPESKVNAAAVLAAFPELVEEK